MDRTEQSLTRDLFDELEPGERARLERRLAADPELRRRHERSRRLIARYRHEGDEEPPKLDLPTLLGGERERSRGPGAGSRLAHVAALLAVAVTAFLAGQATRTPENPETIAHDVRLLAEETAGLRRTVTRLALRHESIAARIEAVERIAVLGRGDASLERALWERLRDDPSVNVRLAAIDVLYSTPDLAPPVDHLIEILAREPAPLLRLALLDWIAAAGPPGWSRVLLAVEANDESAEVRGRARRLLGARS